MTITSAPIDFRAITQKFIALLPEDGGDPTPLVCEILAESENSLELFLINGCSTLFLHKDGSLFYDDGQGGDQGHKAGQFQIAWQGKLTKLDIEYYEDALEKVYADLEAGNTGKVDVEDLDVSIKRKDLRALIELAEAQAANAQDKDAVTDLVERCKACLQD